MKIGHSVVVFGYGCHLVPELKEYLDRVRRFCNQNRPEVIVFCGGFTQRKSAPGVSEAGLMKDYIIPQLSYVPMFVYMERDSFTTPDNAENAAKFIQENNLLGKDTRLTVFCEATRALKTDMLVRHFFGRRANIETASWELMSPEKQIISTIYDWLAIKFPPLARYWRNKRIERSYQI